MGGGSAPELEGASWTPESRSTWSWEPLRACCGAPLLWDYFFFNCFVFFDLHFCFLNSFLKIEFTYHTIHLLEVHNSVAFSLLAFSLLVMCNSHSV